MATKKAVAAKKSPAPKETASKRSLAALFDEADINDANNSLSPGEKELRLNTFTIKEDAKGARAVVQFEALDGDEEGKKVNQMYKLTDEAGNPAPGMAYLKRDLKLLGYEDSSGKKLKKILAELEDTKPMVIVRIKENGQYVNAFIQGLAGEGGAGSDEDASAGGDIEVGSKVTFTNDDDEEVTGTVTKIKEDIAIIKGDDDEKYKVEIDDLTLAEEESESSDDDDDKTPAEIEVGSKVTFTDDDDNEITGEVIKIKANQSTVKDEDGEKYKVDLDELTLVTDDDDDDDAPAAAEIEVGSRVNFTNDDDEEVEGEVTKIKDDVATVKDDDDDKHKVDLSDLELVEE